MRSDPCSLPTKLEAGKLPPPREVLRNVFSFPVLLGALLVAGIFALIRIPQFDPDVWWHIKVGEGILETHHLPTYDVYSFTAQGAPWIAYSWLGDVFLAAAQRAAGIQGVVALGLVLGCAIIVSLYTWATLRCGDSKAAFVASVAVLVLVNVSLTLRPQMLAYLYLILTLIVLELFRKGRQRVVWLLPPLFVLWVNTHSSFTIGLGVTAVYWAAGLVEFRSAGLEARRWTTAQRLRLESAFALCLLALTITPYGTRLAFYPFNYAVALPLGVATVQEWQPIPFGMLFGKVFLVLFLAFVAAQCTLRATWRLGEFVLFLFAAFMTCLHARFILVFVPFFVPMLATLLTRWVPPYDRAIDRRGLNAALVAVIAGGVIAFFPSASQLQESIAKRSPVEAAEYLRHHVVPAPWYNNYGFGGYLVWSLTPAHRVFIDGRSDLYEPVGVLADYLRVSEIKTGGLAVLDEYGINSCLL